MARIFSDPTLLLALRLLAHPLSLGALALLAVNDWLLRRLWPSWWTGKIGDAAWLVFAPWLLAAALALCAALVGSLSAWLRGRRAASAARPNHRLLYAALIITGLGFGLVKSVPVVHAAAARLFGAVLGAAPSLIRDPSDLLALPALLLPFLLLQRRRNPSQGRLAAGPGMRPALRWAALPLAALVLLGDAAAPDMGFQCFERGADGRFYASTGYSAYVSEDGGQTWVFNPEAQTSCSPQAVMGADGWREVDGPGERLYRYKNGGGGDTAVGDAGVSVIQMSLDGGQNWQSVYESAGLSEPEQLFIMKTRSGSPIYRPGPLDAAADEESGSMLFAMGQEGVLLHTKGGDLVWSAGGEYQRAENFPGGEAFAVLLGPMLYMALVLAFLIYATLAFARIGGRLRGVVLALAWLGWLVVGIVFPPPSSYSYGEMFTVFGVLAAAVLLVPLAVELTVRLIQRRAGRFGKLALLALAGGLLYLVPYLLWLYRLLPALNIAIIAGLVIAFAALGAGFALTRRDKTQAA